jgi:DNA-binding response OmpR family regulator
MQLLLVEDEKRVASFVARGLVDAGFPTEVVERGADAVARMHRSDPVDLVLLDVGLPDMDGFSVLEQIRRHDQRTPIIMLTARGDVPSRVKGLDLEPTTTCQALRFRRTAGAGARCASTRAPARGRHASSRVT